MGARPPKVHARGMAGRACTQSSAVSEASASAKTMCEATCQEESRRSCTSTDFGASAARTSSPASTPSPTSVTVSAPATDPASATDPAPATGCTPFATTRAAACRLLSTGRRKPYLLASTAASASALASASASVTTSAFAHNGWASRAGCRLRRRRARCAIIGTSMPSISMSSAIIAPRSSRLIAATAAAAAASAAASAASAVSGASGASATAASSADDGWASGRVLPHGPAPFSTRDERWSWPSWVIS